jgi:hypothetical protein
MRAGGTAHSTNRSILGIGKSMVKLGGVRSLWIGNGANCIKDGPESGIMFMVYERLKGMLMKDPSNPTILEKFCVGM